MVILFKFMLYTFEHDRVNVAATTNILTASPAKELENILT
jgi:hypothetical protein